MDASAAAQPPLATQLQPSHSQVHITADNLRTFCDSLTAFQQCLNDLQRHMNSIQTSINSMLLPPQSLLASSSSPAVATPAPTLAPEPESSWESDPSEDLEEEEEEVNQEEKVVEGEGGEGEGEEVNSTHLELKLPPSELKSPRLELKSPPSELKSPRLELKSPRSELKSPPSELKSLPSELKSPPSELKSPPSELKSLPSELKSPPLELKSPPSELKSPPSELKSPPLELKSPRLELKSLPSELKSLPSELKSPPSELKSPRLELKLPPSELKSPHLELKLPRSELKSPRLELKLPRSELKSPRSELEIFCETMDHCGLRKYMTTHISNFRRLREEVHKALRHSPNPATLVFNCIGKFYITVGKKFANESPLGRGRKAKVLILECLLLMTGIYDKEIELENWVKEEAKHTALAWLERMNSEGGKPQEIDARGLLFFIGGFGIPDQFTNANIRNLLQVSNLKWSCDALKRSNALLAKLPEIIEEMVANKAVVKAVHIVYSVGMQDKFSPRTLLTTFIRECKKSFDDMNGSQSAHQGNIVAKGKYLGDLRSIIKCLRIHEVDPSKVLPGWEIGKRIASLEKEISEFKKQILPDKKIAHGSHKRKKDGNVWVRNKEVKHSHPSNPWPPQHHRVASNVINNNTLFEGGVTADHNYDYFMPPLVLHGPVEGSMHENVGYSLAGPVRGVAIGGPGAGISANSIHAGMDVVPQGVPYAGQGGNRVDSIPGQIGSHAGQFYGSAYRPSTPETKTGDTYRPAPFMESSKGLPNTIPGDSSRTPPYLKVSPGLPNTISSNACRPSPFTESSKGLRKTISGDANRPSPKLEGSMELPNTINGDAYRPPPYLEGSMGLPNTPPPHQFVNTVPATELNQSRGSKAVDAHPSSSLYKQR